MAKGLWAYVNDTYQKAQSLWFASNDGTTTTWNAAKAAWVYTNNAWQKFWPTAGSVKLTAAPPENTQTVPYWSAIKLSWTAAYTQKAVVSDTSTGQTLVTRTYTGSDRDSVTDTYTVTVAPNTTGTYRVDVTDLDNAIVSSQATATTPYVDTPSNFVAKQSGIYGANQTGKYTYVLSWAKVTGMTGYRIQYTVNGAAQTDVTTSTESATVYLSPGVPYSFRLTAYWTSAGNTYYSKEATQTGNTTAIAKNTYIYKPTANSCWQTGTGGTGDAGPKWRTDNYLGHGKATINDGNSTAVARGTQTSVFFSYKNAANNNLIGTDLSTLTNAITGAWIYMGRMKSYGANTALTCYFTTHNLSSKPSGAPTFVNTSVTGSASPTTLTDGQAQWIPINIAYAKAMIAGTIKGFGWGNVTKNFMIGSQTQSGNLTQTTPIGSLKVQIGS